MTVRAAPDPPPALAGPYAARVGPEPHAVSPAVDRLVAAQINALLSSSAAWHELSPAARKALRRDLQKVSAYSAALVQEEFALSECLGQRPMLRTREIVPAAGGDVLAEAAAGRPGAGAAAPTQPAVPAAPPPRASEFAPRAVDQVGRVTKDTLNAIAFPTFVADLIRGTFNAIVDASIKQMEAFCTLLANVAKTVDQFMADNITDNQARDWLTAQYPQHFGLEFKQGADGGRDARGGARGRTGRGASGGGKEAGPSARLRVRTDAPAEKPDFQELGLTKDVRLDDKSVEEVLLPAARRRLAQQRHEMLSTMVLMGINRIVVRSGRISAQMGFTIDASDVATAEDATRYDSKRESVAGAAFLGFGAATHNTVAYVSSSKRDSSDSIDISADLTAEIEMKFESQVFPIERFADLNVINRIQGNTANPAANSPQSAAPGAAPAAP